MKNLAVVYWSGTGNTEKMAMAIAEGAKASGACVDVFTACEFDSTKAEKYEAIALGCPSMGAEQLEDSEFEPMFEGVKDSLKGKKIGLFGSYGWGSGEWMESWEADCQNNGIELAVKSVIVNEAPDQEGIDNCQNLGKTLVE